MHSLLPQSYRLLLTAATRTDEHGLAAFREWRRTVPLDDAPYVAHRVMTQLLELTKRHGINDPDIARMRGVSRHAWTANMLLLKALFSAVAALESARITPVLLKGAALMGRDPSIAQKHEVADYDVLISRTQVSAAMSALRAANFQPAPGFDWAAMDAAATDSVTAGMEVRLPASQRGIDLHWRPIWNNYDEALTREIIDTAERSTLQGHEIRIPAPAHQLFLALARCEPWDADENFRRLLEASQLCAAVDNRIDWNRLVGLVRRYRVQAAATDFLTSLCDATQAAVPDDVLSELRPDATAMKEWSIRSVLPEHRDDRQKRFLALQDEAAGRAPGGMQPAGVLETVIRRYWRSAPPMRLLWWLASRRLASPSTGEVRFLEGFWYPEGEGRWTEQGWAAVAVPGATGEEIGLNAVVHLGVTGLARVGAAGGDRPHVRQVAAADTELRLKVRPLAAFGGDGLILLWLPDATSPHRQGMSQDRRPLGLFLRYVWRR